MNGIPLTGPVSFSTIRSHLLNSGTTVFGLSGAGRPNWQGSQPYSGPGESAQYVPKNRSSYTFPDDALPFSVSEWRGYTHSQHGTCSATSFTTRDIAKDYTYYKVKLTGGDSFTSSISVQANSAPNTNVRTNIYTSYPFLSTGALTTNSPVLSFDLTSASTQRQVFTMSSGADVFFHVVSWQYVI